MTEKIPDTLQNNFRFKYPVELRYSDMDMLGHANNAVYLTYLETARVYYFKDFTRQEWADIAMVLAHVSMDYKIPIVPGSEPEVYLRTSKIGNTSMTIAHVIVDKKSGQVYLTGQVVVVAIDKNTGRPQPIPQEFKDKIIDFEPGQVLI